MLENSFINQRLSLVRQFLIKHQRWSAMVCTVFIVHLDAFSLARAITTWNVCGLIISTKIKKLSQKMKNNHLCYLNSFYSARNYVSVFTQNEYEYDMIEEEGHPWSGSSFTFLTELQYSPFPSSTNSLFENKAKSKPFLAKKCFSSIKTEDRFQIDGFAVSNALKQEAWGNTKMTSVLRNVGCWGELGEWLEYSEKNL